MGNIVEVDVKRLTKWAGFRFVKQEKVVKNTVIPYGSHWIDPEGNPLPDGVMQIDFPNDLNACFGWFEKPLVDHFIEITDTEDEYRVAYFKFMADWLEDYIWNEPHKPALSFCKAIEKMLDNKES